MSALLRAARARVSITPAPCQRRIEIAFAELNVTNDALLAAASGLSVALKQGMVSHSDVYELLRVIHLRLKQTIADAEQATLRTGGAA